MILEQIITYLQNKYPDIIFKSLAHEIRLCKDKNCLFGCWVIGVYPNNSTFDYPYKVDTADPNMFQVLDNIITEMFY